VLQDLLISHPTPENMHIIPTSRDPSSHLALSSRNAYLSSSELEVAPVLYRALSAAKSQFDIASTDNEGEVTGEDLISIATAVILDQQTKLATPDSNLGLETGEKSEGVRLKLDYVEVFDRDTFEPVRGPVGKGRKLVIAGAVWVGQTRLIDNLLLGWDM
jgi:pantoate--beta-alanine ligase